MKQRRFYWTAGMLSLLMGVWLAFPPSSFAKSRITVPVDIGIGPAGYIINNLIFSDQPVHFGLKLYISAIIGPELIRRNRRRIPRRFRRFIRNTTEIRYNPLFFIPDSFIISPKIQRTQMYGITFRPFALGITFLQRPVRVSLGAGLVLTYAFMESDSLGVHTPPITETSLTMHFLRPGVDIKLDIEIPITRSFLVSFGWDSQFYVPQTIGGSILELGDNMEKWMWHFGQFYLLLHFRFPYTTYI